MKKIMFSFFCLLFIVVFCEHKGSAQVPQGFNYQAVARDSDNSVLKNAALYVKIGLLQGSETGTLIWEEIHSVTTNDLGLFTIIIGDTTADNSSGSAATFSDIDWALGSYYMKVQVDDGGGYVDMGSAELLSVPYALFAEEGNEGPTGPQGEQGLAGTQGEQGETGPAGDPATDDQTLSINGHDLTISGGNMVTLPDSIIDDDADPANEIQDLQLSGHDLSITNKTSPTVIDLSTYLDNSDYWTKNGDTIYVTGTDVGIGTTSPGVRLQVKGETTNDEEPLFEVKNKDGQTVFAVYNNGVRVYVDDSGAKGLKGGFAVGGYNSSKGSIREFLRVTDDSTRIYVSTDGTKGLKGGFAVGGFSPGKNNPATGFMHMTKDNYFIGHKSGQKTTGGLYNSFIGYRTGYNNDSGNNNTFLGDSSGFGNTAGSGNLFVGKNSGISNVTGDYNSFIGYQSGYSNTNGVNNSFLGSFAGFSNTSGSYNTFVGDSVGYSNTNGSENSFYGDKAGFNNIDGTNNVFMGNFAGYSNTIGDTCVFIGNRSGYSNISGVSNVFIGNRAGYSTWGGMGEGGSYNVFLGNHAGYSNDQGHSNVFIGNMTGYSNTTGNNNVFLGYYAGYKNTMGQRNVCLGYQAGYSNIVGRYNVLIGHQTGYYLRSVWGSNVMIGDWAGKNTDYGHNNVFLGNRTGYDNTSGAKNTYIGSAAGSNNTTGLYNIFMGYKAGYYETTSNRLYIENSDANSTDALIWGNFENDILAFNGKVGIGTLTPGTSLSIVGLTGTSSGSYLKIYNNDVYYSSSSRKTKKDIIPLEEDFEKILKAEPVEFNDIETGERNIGYIAEDFDKLGLGNLVIYQNGEPISLSYELVSLYNLEIIKEQQKMIENQQSKIDKLEKMVYKLIDNMEQE